MQSGEGECLYDDILALVEKLKAANVDVTHESYLSMPHMWHLFRAVTPQGDQALKSAMRFISVHTKE